MKYSVLCSAASVLLLSLLPSPAQAAIRLNEIHANPPGAPDGAFEYLEVISTTGGVEACTGLTVVFIDGNGGDIGKIEMAVSINGLSTGSNGILHVGSGYTSPNGGPYSAVVDPNSNFGSPTSMVADNLGPNGGMTVLLVTGYNGAIGQDLDTDDNGSFNLTRWTTIVDAVGYGDAGKVFPPAANLTVNFGLAFGPDNFSRLAGDTTANSAAAWYGGDILATVGSASTGYDPVSVFGDVLGAATPGQTNFGAAATADLLINEVNLNPAGDDSNFEYIEVISRTGGSELANGYTLVMIETDFANNGNLGQIREAWDLSGFSTGSNGMMLIGNGYTTSSSSTPFTDLVDINTIPVDPTGLGDGDIGGNDAFSLLLVTGFTGAIGADLDTNNDGTLDLTPWTEIRDSVGFGKLNLGQNANLTETYALGDVSQTVLGFGPDNASRLLGNTDANSAAAWYGGEFGGADGSNIAFGNTTFGPFQGIATPGYANLGSEPDLQTALINEVHVDPPSSDNVTNGEFIEIISPTLGITSLNRYSLLRVTTDSSRDDGNIGEVREVWNLSGNSTGANGLFLIGDDYDNGFPAGYSPFVNHGTHVSDVDGLDIGDVGPNEAMGLLLVADFDGAIGTDLDSNDDGTYDEGLGFLIVDSVAFGSSVDPGVTDLTQTGFVPGNFSRLPGNIDSNSEAAWYGGVVTGANANSVTYSPTQYFGPYLGGATPGAYNHVAAPGAGNIRLNEVNINPAGSDDNYEYVEILSADLAEESLSGYSIIVVDTAGGNVGTVLEIWDLDGLATGKSGLLLVGHLYDMAPLGGPHSANLMPFVNVADPPFLGSNDLEDGGIGVLLVRGFSGRLGDDLNPDNPVPPATDDNFWQDKNWNTLVDSVAFGEHIDPAFANVTGAAPNDFNPDNISRLNQNTAASSAAAWYSGDFLSTAIVGTQYAFDPLQNLNTGSFAGNGAATPGAYNLGNNANIDDSLDLDGDGASKLLEVAVGMDPDAPDADRLPFGSVVNVSGTDYQSLTYRRIAGGGGTDGVDYVAGGIQYTVEVSDDLLTWASGAPEVATVSVGPVESGYQEVVIRIEDGVNSSGSRKYMRLRVIRL